MTIPANLIATLFRATGTAIAQAVQDLYFNRTTLLLKATGATGANNNTFIDSSPNAIALTGFSAPTQGSFSPYSPVGWGGQFDTATTRISVPASATLAVDTGDFTAEAFINMSSLPNSSGLNGGVLFGDLVWQAGYQGGWYVSITSTRSIEFVRSGSSSSWDSVASASGIVGLNAWYHIAVVRQSAVTNVYLNGVSVLTFANPQNYTEGRTFYINAGVGDGTHYGTFKGLISNLRLVKGNALYTSNFTVPTQQLTAVSGTALLTLQDGRFKDNSTNNHQLSVVGSLKIIPSSPFAPTAPYSPTLHGGSAYLNGTSDYIANPTHNIALGSADFTIEGWYYMTTPKTLGTLFSVGAYNSGIMLRYDSLYYMGSAMSVAGTLPVNTWFHVAVVRSGTSLVVYVNGVNVRNTLYGSPISTASGTFIGTSAHATTTESFPGYISDFRVVVGTALYTANFTPVTTPLTAVAGTALLCKGTNAGIVDAVCKNDVQTIGNASVSNVVTTHGVGSVAFDGSGDYLVIPHSTLTSVDGNDFTIECWFNPTTVAPVYQGLITKGFGVQLYLDTNSVKVVLSSSNNSNYFLSHTSTKPIAVGQWYHIALTKSGTTYQVFLDGVLELTAASPSNPNTVTAPTIIGAVSTGQFSLNGYMSDVRITNGAARYTAAFTPLTGPLAVQ